MKAYSIKLIVIIALLIQVLPVASQIQSSKVKPEDYHKWGTLSVGTLSPDGKWASYRMEYEQDKDTLFIKRVQDLYTRAFVSVKTGAFSPDSSFFICHMQNDSLYVYNLNTFEIKKYGAISRFEFSKKGNYIVLLRRNQEGNNTLLVSNGSYILKEIPNVTDYSISNNGLLAWYNKNNFIITNPLKGFEEEEILKGPFRVIKKIIWSDNNGSMAFLAQRSAENTGSENCLYYYNRKSKSLKTIQGGFSTLEGHTITHDMQTPVILSEDGKQVFFYSSSIQAKPNKPDEIPEVWDSSTKLVYPAGRIYGDTLSKSKLTVWYPKNNVINILATDEFPIATLTSDRKYALIFSHLTHEPQYKMVSDVDYQLVEVATGKSSPFLKEQPTTPYSIGCSPNGRYIHYFKNQHWWVYDIQNNNHTNITFTLKTSFCNNDFDEPGIAEGYKCPGWINDNKYLILYDHYDIWLVTADGKHHHKITNGRENKITYRICDYLYGNGKSQGSADFVKRNFDVSKGFYIEAKGYDKSSGYFFWKKTTGLTKITYDAKKTGFLQRALQADSCLYIDEDFKTPPSLQFACPEKPFPKKLFQSNPHYLNYLWGDNELLSYTNKNGDTLQGILYYPAGYQKDKKYPMVVYIYSKLSQNLHEYYNPVSGHPIGFQPVNYINDGYLVLMPDIKYEVGAPGKSIVDCVEAAVNYVTDKGVADKNRIGIIGHSYGGYETCYLISQSKLFAAAVAGAAVTDVISSYLSVNSDTGDKMDWRFESQQYRLGVSPFEDLQLYLEHSTVLNATKINTPLLSWAGKDDISVDHEQGIELHLALRRLGKRNVFLVYPKQGHILTDTNAKTDLSNRTKKWFDHYLKDTDTP
ncbi:alpha/beta hydrolase family protein [Flavobacterium psychrotrophum]|uniref:alpha/beta hydrolase family protein n=1 Tax=Flavobacterium psychrotrophum TaxID=2294119 RepID=UPI000E317074|nr:prolyl oligopeptidase family serine peptidase [Flavobacterium psychrotrophum]